MESLLDSKTIDELTHFMVQNHILDDIKSRWPKRNAKMMTTAALIHKWPEELAITPGAPVCLACNELFKDIDNDSLYEQFYNLFVQWRRLDIDVMTNELNSARDVVNDTLSRTPPDKDWFKEWERGSELQTNLLSIANNFLEKCKLHEPKM